MTEDITPGINCPHCGFSESKVTDTDPGPSYLRRYRDCRGCGKTFTTIERVAVWGGRAAGYIEAGQLVEPTDPEPEPAKPKLYVAAMNDKDLATLVIDAQPLMVQWWNVSRRSKWGKKATWTEGAWRQNVKRVAALPHWKQVALAAAGVEHGWQALKVDYLTGSETQPPIDAGLQPKSTAMQEAIASWNNKVA